MPQGFRVGAPAWAIHHDEDFYSNPSAYDAFRFSRPREEFQAARLAAAKSQPDSSESTEIGLNQADKEEMIHYKKQSLATTKSTFLHFGHGRHAW